ncbi:MAG: NTP transferase domain-containing protein [Nocardioides sp.]
MRVHGLLLAAGAGLRFGGPKALARDADGTSWLPRAVTALREGGCDALTVVLGAGAVEARDLLDPAVAVVVATRYADGMSASLRAGLEALLESRAGAALVSLVDLPDVDARVVARVLAAGAGPDALARATYDGVPGHPVLLGRAHWPGILTTTQGDRGAREYLATQRVVPVECGDLATGTDVDVRP